MNRKKYILKNLIIFILVLLFKSLRWAQGNYANISLEQIMFHVNMTLEGTSNDLIIGYIKNAFVPSIIITMAIGIGGVVFSKVIKENYYLRIETKHGKKYFELKKSIFVAISLIAFIVTLTLAEHEFSIIEYCKNQTQKSNFIEQEYVNTENVTLKFPEKKRNLINIYIESGDASYQDIDSGGKCEINYIPEITKLAEENISFSHSDLIDGATVAPACGWTIAGLVAETAGVPLKLYKYGDVIADNSMSNYDAFLHGVTSIGDILEEQGYKNFFMAGSEFEFGGRKSYYTSHGNFEIWDYNTAVKEEKIPKDYRVFWGFEDRKLYQFAKEELLELAENEQPFNFSMLTVDTHQPAGYVCELCDSEYEEQYANVWSCASKQLKDFVEWIQEQEFYENTTIAIIGDHSSMSPELIVGNTSGDKYHGTVDRKVFNIFINAVTEPVQEKNRMFTTMDMFPTVLASIGVEIEGNKLALGTNLFSDEVTLAEEYGYEVLFEELDKKSDFYNQQLMFP